MNQPTPQEKLALMEARQQRIVQALEMMAEAGEFQKEAEAAGDQRSLYKAAARRVEIVVDARAQVWIELSAATLDLAPVHYHPESCREEMKQLINRLRDDGSIAMALSRPGPLLLPGGGQQATLIIQALESRNEILGLLIASTAVPAETIHQAELLVLNATLTSTALALENTRLTRQLLAAKANLTQEVALKTVHLREALSAAELASKAKSDFLAAMSHELRNPLHAISGSLEILGPEVRNQVSLKSAASACRRLTAIVDDILDWTKLEAGSIQIQVTPFDPVCLTEEACEIIRDLAREKKIDFHCSIDTALAGGVIGDRRRILQILGNLLSNAVKFTESGSIRLSLRSGPAGSLLFSVQDSGIGIPEDKQQSIFLPFQQQEGGFARRHGGSGLGLALCGSLARMMGASISVNSRPGKGSTFTLEIACPPAPDFVGLGMPKLQGRSAALLGLDADTWIAASSWLEYAGMSIHTLQPDSPLAGTSRPDLLIADDSVAPGEILRIYAAIAAKRLVIVRGHGVLATQLSSVTSGEIFRPLRRGDLWDAAAGRLASPSDVPLKFRLPEGCEGRILVTDDDSTNRDIAQHMLNRLGLQVSLAASGAAAVEATSIQRFDLILMDCHMPGMDGLEATMLIRQNEAALGLRRTPIIAFTADVVNVESRLAEVGMEGILSKPARIDDLLAILKRWVGKLPEGLQVEARAPAAPRRPAADAELPKEHLDLSVLQTLIGGPDPDFERMLLREFDSKAQTQISELTEALVEKDIKRAAMIAHTLKGSSGNVGARRLYSLALKIETTIKAESLEEAKSQVIDLADEYLALSAEIHRLYP
ncbi:MAG: hypothetical protein RL095_3280 [Verrucomicrobiota bacterium]|jgi:signal transduction histidine kinase/HPt (histidine-containing phosphotransfer) domain-containing protein/DNA-binding NarL/FixJ family response regulator